MHSKKAMSMIVTIILALVTFLIILGIYNTIYGKSKIDIDNKLSCKGALGVGYGECLTSEQCRPPSQKVASNDCKDDDKVCCISLEKPDSVMPEAYGGSKELNFEISYIGPKTVPSGCEKDGEDYLLICTPGTPITLSIKIGVENLGTKALDVYANPTVVDLSGALSPNRIKGATAVNIASKKSQEVFVNYDFKGPATATGRSYRIYPAVICQSNECKKTNADGVFRKLESAYINVAFVK